MKDFHMTVRLRNNQLRQRREELGLSPKVIAERAGISYEKYLALESMRKAPVVAAGGWSKTAVRLASFHGVDCAELFPASVREVTKTEVQTIVDLADIAPMLAMGPDEVPLLQDAAFEQLQFTAVAMAYLEQHASSDVVHVVRERGLYGCTLDEAGAKLGLSRERTRQLYETGLGLLRHGAERDFKEKLSWEECVASASVVIGDLLEGRYMRVGSETPWGRADRVSALAVGVWEVVTPSHGGVRLEPARNARVAPEWRRASGWYEEDVEWAIVAFTFSDLFSEKDTKRAHTILKDNFPAEYGKVTGTAVAERVSRVLRSRAFARAHHDDFIARAAWGAWHPKVPMGFIGISARHTESQEERYFLVPVAEYESRSEFGFVVDLVKHKPWDDHT